MKTKRQYITPNLKPVVIEERLLETISGSGQQGGPGWGGKSKMSSPFDDFDDFEAEEQNTWFVNKNALL